MSTCVCSCSFSLRRGCRRRFARGIRLRRAVGVRRKIDFRHYVECRAPCQGSLLTIRARATQLAAVAVPLRPPRLTEVSPPPPTVRQRPIRSLGDVPAITKRHTTSRLTHCVPLLGISDLFPHPVQLPPCYSRWLSSRTLSKAGVQTFLR